ncbi:MAG TPA: hypothetical protein VFN48_08860 [Solirubrobacteraceae bacterium]|nr:hypothetical protein [Solirubrobacteraceae bacterium]
MRRGLTALAVGVTAGFGAVAPALAGSGSLASSGDATSVGAHAVDLNGIVDSPVHGARWRFAIGRTRSFAHAELTPALALPGRLVAVERRIAHLRPDTTYFWRVELISPAVGPDHAGRGGGHARRGGGGRGGRERGGRGGSTVTTLGAVRRVHTLATEGGGGGTTTTPSETTPTATTPTSTTGTATTPAGATGTATTATATTATATTPASVTTTAGPPPQSSTLTS